MSPENRHLLKALLGGAAATLPLTLLGAVLAGQPGPFDMLAVLGLPAPTHLAFGAVMAWRSRSAWTWLATGAGVLGAWTLLAIMVAFSDDLTAPSQAAMAIVWTAFTAGAACLAYLAGALLGLLARKLLPSPAEPG